VGQGCVAGRINNALEVRELACRQCLGECSCALFPYVVVPQAVPTRQGRLVSCVYTVLNGTCGSCTYASVLRLLLASVSARATAPASLILVSDKLCAKTPVR
jgi:hypothetical protein